MLVCIVSNKQHSRLPTLSLDLSLWHKVSVICYQSFVHNVKPHDSTFVASVDKCFWILSDATVGFRFGSLAVQGTMQQVVVTM